MKKVVMGALLINTLLGTSLLADWDLHGQITAVDPTNKTITMQGMGGTAVIQILPYTELKGDDCGPWGNDVYGTFNDLTVGKFVEADVYPANMPMPAMQGAQGAQGTTPNIAQGAQYIAKDIEWKCMPRAY